jgi:hypothetical protein
LERKNTEWNSREWNDRNLRAENGTAGNGLAITDKLGTEELECKINGMEQLEEKNLE